MWIFERELALIVALQGKSIWKDIWQATVRGRSVTSQQLSLQLHLDSSSERRKGPLPLRLEAKALGFVFKTLHSLCFITL